jgi:ABC-type transport system involved in multi-copper enzyme maturation permease subunit
MSTIALPHAHQQSRALRRPHPLFAVVAWELRRYRASRLFWLQALLFFGLVLFVTWVSQMPSQFSLGNANATFIGFVAGTSAWGLLLTLPNGVLLLLGLLLPFVNADGVSRDLSRRTHELLMTTTLPSWAYVWGRYLVGLLTSLGLALLLLAGLLGMGMVLHLTNPAYPLPELGPVLLLWIGMVVTATVLVSSLSFALGTVFLRQSILVKIVIMLAWFIGALVLPGGGGGQSGSPSWYSKWDPTSATTALGLLPGYQAAFNKLPHTVTSAAQFQQGLIAIENQVPNISDWLAPHLILAVCSLLLVPLAARTFQRFRGALSAS